MKKIALLSLFLIGISFQTAVAQRSYTAREQQDIRLIEEYLNSLHSLRAHFVQTAPDGGKSRGQAWLQRPGRMRFEYAQPSPFLLVAGHGLLVFHDSSLKQTSNIPLNSTPIGILLREKIQLSGDITITRILRTLGQIQISMVRTASPGEGTLTLIFQDQPLELREWIIRDSQAKQTRVEFDNVIFGGTFDQKLFEFIDPKFFQNNSGG